MDNFGVNPRGPISNGFWTPEIFTTGGYMVVHIQRHVNAVEGGGGGNVEVLGKYLNDAAAVADGLIVGDYYLLESGNDYGMKEGTVVQVSEPVE